MSAKPPPPYQEAVARLKAGQVEQAMQAFLQVAPSDAYYFAARLNLGIHAHQQQRWAEAEQHYQAALQAAPHDPQSQKQLFNLYRAQNRQEDIKRLTQQWLHDGSHTLQLWQQRATLLREVGDIKAALICYDYCRHLQPDNPNFSMAMSNLLMAQNRVEEAIAVFKGAVMRQPHLAQVMHRFTRLLRQAGHLEEAEAWLRRLIDQHPDQDDGRIDLANLLMQQGQLEDAAQLLEQNRAECAISHINLGVIRNRQERFAQARTHFEQGVALDPENRQAIYNLANLYINIKQYDQAQTLLERATVQQPDIEEWHTTLAKVYEQQGQTQQAIHCLEQLLARKANRNAWMQLSALYRNSGQHPQALEAIEQAIKLDPDHLEARSHQLFLAHYLPDTDQPQMVEQAKIYGKRAQQQAKPKPHPPPQALTQPLRIGWVSGDLRNHPVGYFLEAITHHFDPQRIELFAYNSGKRGDALTQRLQQTITHWRHIQFMDDAQVAQLIRQDGIQILVDLSGHTAKHRLPLFAWKPAPIQATWLGYSATTGIAQIDYIMGNAHTLPEAEAHLYVEKRWLLPHSHLCFTAPDLDVEVNPLPALETGSVTFGCFNKVAKYNPEVYQCWAEILHRIPNSRLYLKQGIFSSAQVTEQVKQAFKDWGIDANRLILEGGSERHAYFRCYHQVDMILDPFPFPGGTTSVEGLWMGVPFVTLKGHRFMAHQGESLLHHAGLASWIAEDTQDYVEKVVALARDLPALAQLRQTLREQVLASPLFDAPLMANDLMTAWECMWAEAL
ncbi:tetratricopeptide repeat protein [Magnetococcus sp. PR-3]|uniref:tetratricopeptide repeat protein n=1 Tax=Magnetococcus sp. PR-3 TaxID=3120355 RepID=UPI002FCE32F3